MSDFHAWWTVALLVVFIGIVAWAWSGRRRKDFEQAARIPLDDDGPAPETRRERGDERGEKHNG